MKSETVAYAVVSVVALVCLLVISSTHAYNDDRGFQKWSPYWLSNYRYSPPMSYYTATSSRGGLPKRFGERGPKWSPLYLSEGLYGRPSYTSYKMTSDGFDDEDANVASSGED